MFEQRRSIANGELVTILYVLDVAEAIIRNRENKRDPHPGVQDVGELLVRHVVLGQANDVTNVLQGLLGENARGQTLMAVALVRLVVVVWLVMIVCLLLCKDVFSYLLEKQFIFLWVCFCVCVITLFSRIKIC